MSSSRREERVNLQKGVEPATVVAVNGLQEVDWLAELIAFQAGLSQAVYRTRTRHTRWIVVRWRRGASRSIPVYVLLDSMEKSIGGAPDVKAERP
jgi:hypothetical protein